MLTLVVAAPQTENPWGAIRRAFDVFVTLNDVPQDRDRARALREIVESSPVLRAASLERNEALQRRLTDALVERDASEGRAVLRAVVGAAFASLSAATESCDAHDEAAGSGPFAAELDRVMARLEPRLAEG